jgi:hypothetical protein
MSKVALPSEEIQTCFFDYLLDSPPSCATGNRLHPLLKPLHGFVTDPQVQIAAGKGKTK